MSDIGRQFSLGYLKGTPREPQTPNKAPLPPFLDEALIAYGRPMLDILQAAAPNTVLLHDLLDRVKWDIETALKVVDYLEEQGLLQIKERDRKGNHRLALTDRGRHLVSPK
jgi:predicted transcriptional regulator